MAEESFDHVIRTNLKGTFFLTQAAARRMLDNPDEPPCRGAIVNITSISSTVASIDRGEYCMAKAGLSMATRLWAARLTQHNIMVYEVRPDIIETDMTSGIKDKYDKLIDEGLTLQRRWGRPDDIAKAVASLACGDFAFAPGHVFITDGGLTLPRL